MSEISNNDIRALTDPQLEDSLDAMWFAESGFASEEIISADSSVTSANSGALSSSLDVGAQQYAGAASALTIGQSTVRNPSSIQGGAVQSYKPTTNYREASTSTTTTASSTPAFASSTPLGGTSNPQRPQLFGKEVAFSMPVNLPPPVSGVHTHHTSGKKRKQMSSSFQAVCPPVSEDESERERRRQDRNYREQQRSQQISNQIVVLRNILEDAKVECKPDKFSTLTTVVDYVKALQQRSTMLEAEHKKVLDTIRQTTEIMSSQYMSVQANSSSSNNREGADGKNSSSNNNNNTSASKSSSAANVRVVSSATADTDQVYVQGLDYKSIFRASPFALATTSIDGRFLDCTQGFESLTRFSREELLPMKRDTRTDDSVSTTSEVSSRLTTSSGSEGPPPCKNLSLFNVLNQSDMGPVYHAMYNILQHPMNHLEQSEESSSSESDDTSNNDEPAGDHWSSRVKLSRNKKAQVR